MPDWTHIGQLKPDPLNARQHNPRNVGLIVDALHEVGAARSIVVDEDGVILAGNATVEAAAEAGIERVQVVDADGSTIVAVRRSGLSPEAKRRLALYDNRAAELADWDSEILAAFAMDDPAVFDGLFDGDELAELVAGFAFGDTSTDRDGQGVGSTWDQVKDADAGKVIIGAIESRLPQDVIDMLERFLTETYERDGTPIYETLEAVIVAGMRAIETGDIG